MPINLSASVWNYLCADGPDADLAEAIGEISESGLGIELWLNWRADPSSVAPDRWPELAKMLGSASVSLHSAMKTWDSETFKTEVEMASYLGAPILVVHANSLGLTSDPCETPDMEPCIRASDYASSQGVVLALENLPVPSSVELLRKTVAAAPRMRVCIDMAHAFVAKDDIADTIEQFGRKVVHIHVSDNRGDTDDHLVPGDGEIPDEAWKRAFAKLADIGYPGSIVMELRSNDAKRASQRGAAFLRHIIGETHPASTINVDDIGV